MQDKSYQTTIGTIVGLMSIVMFVAAIQQFIMGNVIFIIAGFINSGGAASVLLIAQAITKGSRVYERAMKTLWSNTIWAVLQAQGLSWFAEQTGFSKIEESPLSGILYTLIAWILFGGLGMLLLWRKKDLFTNTEVDKSANDQQVINNNQQDN